MGLDDDGWALVCAVKEALKVNLKAPFIHLRHPTVPANPYDNVFGVGAATEGSPFVADEVIAAFQTYLQAFDTATENVAAVGRLQDDQDRMLHFIPR